MNVYAYVGNNPLNWVDVTGLAKGKPGPNTPPSREPPRRDANNPSKRDDLKETQGQPDPPPPPPVNPGQGCSKFFENCVKFCIDRCRSVRVRSACVGGCFTLWLLCETAKLGR